MNRRRFLTLAGANVAGLALVGCGSGGEESARIEVTRIADVEGAPPTLAPNATPPSTQGGGQEGGAPPAGGGAQPVQLEARDPFAWSQTELQVAPGQTIAVTNVGALQHTFAVDEWGLDENLPNGETVDIPVPQDAQPGQALEFYCSVPGHREGGMVGTLTVVEAGQAGGEASPQASPEGSPQPSPVAEGQPPQPPQPAAGGPIQLEAVDIAWSQTDLTVSPGQTIAITNTGVLPHDFVVDEWGISQDIPNGGSIEVQVPQDVQPGQSFVFYCSEPGHRASGMEGTIAIA